MKIWRVARSISTAQHRGMRPSRYYDEMRQPCGQRRRWRVKICARIIGMAALFVLRYIYMKSEK